MKRDLKRVEVVKFLDYILKNYSFNRNKGLYTDLVHAKKFWEGV